MISSGELTIRILIAAALGGFIGLERELRDQPAGLRTHMLVAIGAGLFTLVGAYGFESLSTGAPSAVRADVTRVASQIVVGIGFLGGGTILRHGATVRGLTTAASLWVTAAVGLAVGIGMYQIATVTAVVTVVAMAFLKPLEKRMTSFRIRSDQEPPSIPPD